VCAPGAALSDESRPVKLLAAPHAAQLDLRSDALPARRVRHECTLCKPFGMRLDLLRSTRRALVIANPSERRPR
jgi:hypothetical protein